MSVIVINCVTLVSYQPCRDISVCDGKCQILKIVDDVIFAYFAAEMIIKMVGNNHIISLIIPPPHIFPRWPWECLVEGATSQRAGTSSTVSSSSQGTVDSLYFRFEIIFETFSCSRFLDYFEFSGGAVNLTAIRTVRVLRPLRAINRIPSMLVCSCVFKKLL